MIKQQIIDFLYCCGAGFCCGCFGLLFGFFDWQGRIYFDLQGAITMFLMLFVAAFVACLVDKVKQYNQQ